MYFARLPLFPKHPKINYTRRVIFVFSVVIHTFVKMHACLTSKENNKYAKSISGHVDGNDSGAVSMKKQRKFSCYGLSCENRQTAAFYCLTTTNSEKELFAESSHLNNIGIFQWMVLY